MVGRPPEHYLVKEFCAREALNSGRFPPSNTVGYKIFSNEDEFCSAEKTLAMWVQREKDRAAEALLGPAPKRGICPQKVLFRGSQDFLARARAPIQKILKSKFPKAEILFVDNSRMDTELEKLVGRGSGCGGADCPPEVSKSSQARAPRRWRQGTRQQRRPELSSRIRGDIQHSD